MSEIPLKNNKNVLVSRSGLMDLLVTRSGHMDFLNIDRNTDISYTTSALSYIF